MIKINTNFADFLSNVAVTYLETDNKPVSSSYYEWYSFSILDGVPLTDVSFNALTALDRFNLVLNDNTVGYRLLYKATLFRRRYGYIGQAGTFLTSNTDLNNITKINIPIRYAQRETVAVSGTATWWVFSNTFSPTNNPTLAPNQAHLNLCSYVVGTVGVVGSGEDLELNTNNLSVGQEIVIPNINLIVNKTIRV